MIKNVRHQVRRIATKPAIAEKVATGALRVVGAFYEKRSGMVDFIRCDDFAAAAAPHGVHVESEPMDSEEQCMEVDESERNSAAYMGNGANAHRGVAASSAASGSGGWRHRSTAGDDHQEEAIIGDGPARIVGSGYHEGAAAQHQYGSEAKRRAQR